MADPDKGRGGQDDHQPGPDLRAFDTIPDDTEPARSCNLGYDYLGTGGRVARTVFVAPRAGNSELILGRKGDIIPRRPHPKKGRRLRRHRGRRSTSKSLTREGRVVNLIWA